MLPQELPRGTILKGMQNAAVPGWSRALNLACIKPKACDGTAIASQYHGDKDIMIIIKVIKLLRRALEGLTNLSAKSRSIVVPMR